MIANQEKKKLDFETFFCVAFFAVSNFSRMLQHFGVSRVVTYVVYLIFFFVFFLKNITKLQLVDLIYHAVIIFIVADGLIKYASYIDSKTTIYACIISFVPAYFFFRFSDFEAMVRGFRISTYFSVVYLLIYYVIFVIPEQAYSMNYAYWIATPMCAIFYYYLSEHKTRDLILFIICFMTVLVSGCRGALILSVCCCMFFLATKYSIRKKPILWIAIGILLLIISFTWNNILMFLGKYFGFSRNITKLLDGEFIVSNTRNVLYEKCKSLIEDRPGGYGPLASRKIINNHPYPHSLFYEMQLDFGKIAGMALFLLVIILLVYVLFKFRKTNINVIVAIICIIGVGSLMVSSTYYQEIYVPAVFALFVQARKQKGMVEKWES